MDTTQTTTRLHDRKQTLKNNKAFTSAMKYNSAEAVAQTLTLIVALLAPVVAEVVEEPVDDASEVDASDVDT